MGPKITDKYEFLPVEETRHWDEFIENSPQGTIFSSSIYLDAVGRSYRRFFVAKGHQIKAALCCIVSDNGESCELDDLVIYNGIIYHRDHDKKFVKSRSERFEIAEVIIEKLGRDFTNIELALSPHFEDMRPFLWHNYHSHVPADKFEADLRYTSYLDISNLSEVMDEEESPIFKNMDTVRKRNIREARQMGGYAEPTDDVDLFIAFYEALMNSQSDPSSYKKLNQMRSVIQTLLNHGKAIMLSTKNAQDEIIYLTVFCFDKKRAYYLFGAGLPSARERFKGTLGVWEGFKVLSRKYGIRQIDLEGVNSPNRGWFKLSFGGNLIPYFQVYKRAPGQKKNH